MPYEYASCKLLANGQAVMLVCDDYVQLNNYVCITYKYTIKCKIYDHMSVTRCK